MRFLHKHSIWVEYIVKDKQQETQILEAINKGESLDSAYSRIVNTTDHEYEELRDSLEIIDSSESESPTIEVYDDNNDIIYSN